MLRSYSPADREAVRTLINDGMRERWGADFDPEANPDTNDMGASYLATGGEIVVVEDDDTIVATGTLTVEHPADDRATGGARLVRMSVASTHRRQGLARRIVAELVARARARRLSPIVVSTDTPWPEAVALYRSCGFKVVAQDKLNTHFELEDPPPDRTNDQVSD